MSFNAFHENKILAKNSEFTVYKLQGRRLYSYFPKHRRTFS